ncbi:MAG: Gfo/Idh/MocA family oxidoreductase [Sedimentisphaerales bacterium]
MVKLAMIGAGGYAFNLMKWIWEIPEKIKIVAVTSNPARKSPGRAACQEKGIPVYDNADQLIEKVKGAADVIYVPTPINTHFNLTKKCIDAGFDVFLEKPPVAIIQELDELIKYVSQHGKKVPVAFQYLHSTIVQELKKRIVEGRYGKVKRVKGMAGWPRFDSYYSRSNWAGKLRLDGDWILDGTINNPLAHMLADQLYLTSDKAGRMAEPVSIEAELYHAHNIESEDTSSLRIITDKGIEVLFNTTLCSDTKIDTSVIIECEKAKIEYAAFCKATITLANGEVEKIDDPVEKRVNMLKILADCHDNGKPYLVTLETCRPFMLAVNGAFESCGEYPHSIDKKYLTYSKQSEPGGDTIKTVIKDIDRILKDAHEKGKLFSEVGAEWAKKSKKFSLKGYKKFPTAARFD